MSKQPSAEFSLASPIAEANNHDSNRDSVGQDDVLSPHNPSDIRNAIGGAVVSTSQAPPAPPQYLLQAATSAQEQIMKRDEILRPIFGEVGDLYNDFTCAVESAVLLHGRMFLTSKFLCFYSNLFGLEKKIRIPWSHITSINKVNTALVIPNAISVTTQRKEYIFRSFWDRDEAHVYLVNMSQYGKRNSGPRTSQSSSTPARRQLEGDLSSRESGSGVGANSTGHNPEHEPGVMSAASLASISSVTTPAKPRSSTPSRRPVSVSGSVSSTQLTSGSNGTNEVWGGTTSEKQYDLLNSKSSSTQPSRRHSAPKDGLLAVSSASSSAALTSSSAATPSDKGTSAGAGSHSSVRPTTSRPMLSIFRSNKHDHDGESSAAVAGTSDPGSQSSHYADSLITTQSSKTTTPVDEELETEELPAGGVERSASNVPGDLSSLNEVTPEQVSKWNAGLEAEVAKHKLAAVIVSGNMNITLLEFCQLFVDNGAPFGLEKFHEYKGDHHLELSDWADNTALGAQFREFKFIKPLKNVPGVSESHGSKAQKLSRFGSVGIALSCSCTVEDVPGCTTFTVETMLVVTALNPNDPKSKGVRVEIQYEIKFVKSTMLKYMIQSATDKDMNTWLKSYFTYYEEHVNEFKAHKERETTKANSPAVPPDGAGPTPSPDKPNVVFGKVIAITPAAESPVVQPEKGNKTSPKDRVSLGFFAQVATFAILLLLSLQWQRTHATVKPIKSQLDVATQSIQQLVDRQAQLERKLDDILSLLTNVRNLPREQDNSYVTVDALASVVDEIHKVSRKVDLIKG